MHEKFRQFVKGFCSIGYGAMIQIISEEWYKSCVKRGEPIEGVLVGKAIGLLNVEERQQAEQELSERTGVKP